MTMTLTIIPWYPGLPWAVCLIEGLVRSSRISNALGCFILLKSVLKIFKITSLDILLYIQTYVNYKSYVYCIHKKNKMKVYPYCLPHWRQLVYIPNPLRLFKNLHVIHYVGFLKVYLFIFITATG